ncbi:MAG: response regulator [Nitrospirae bacterium]|nr:response regulator [Nitrospirota bacterium]
MEDSIKLLIVDDEPELLDVLQWHLQKYYEKTYLTTSPYEALEMLSSTKMDILITDLRMPGMDGLALYKRGLEFSNDLQCIVITGHGEIDSAIEAMKLGAINYLHKPMSIAALLAAIDKGKEKIILMRRLKLEQDRLKSTNELLKEEIEKRKTAEEAIRDAAIKYQSLMDYASDAIFISDESGYLLEVNKKAEELSGYNKGELLKLHYSVFVPVEKLEFSRKLNAQLAETGFMVANDLPLLRKDGATIPVDLTGSLIELGGVKLVQTIIRDISYRKKMEEEMNRAQKLDGLGLLAGGIAHDFNNIMTVILGQVMIAMEKLDPVGGALKNLSEAEKAIKVAKGLSLKLLTFSQGGSPKKAPVRLARLLSDTVQLTLSGSNVECRMHIAQDLWSVVADEGQVSQAISNIAINALQAMNNGGVLEISADNAMIEDDTYVTLAGGMYVKLVFKDNGPGIPADNLQRIFDPYFTTKESGSGLGLTIAYSIIKKHNGYVDIDSTYGVGTSFTIYLPASVEEHDTCQPCQPTQSHYDHPLTFSKKKVLLMDDNEGVLETISELLELNGYEVGKSRDSIEAVQLYLEAMKSSAPFDVVVLDLTVPGGFGGKKAMEELLKIDPKVKAIIASGYSDDPIVSQYRQYGFQGVITKPYDVDELNSLINNMA